MKRLTNASRKLRKLQHLIQLFNLSNAFIVLFIKVAADSLAIISVFLAIRISFPHPLVTIFCLAFAADAILVFIGLYNSTFAIPQDFKRTKKRIRLACKLLALRRRGAVDEETGASIIVREVASVRAVGIKVGDFRHLERQSTPNFLMFVLFNTGRLLVTLKGWI
jgi:hypothetical protein